MPKAQQTRAGLRATKVDVDVLVDDPPHRTWRTIADLIAAADLPEPVRDQALRVFGRLADAEGHVHGIPAADVHFHEVGALDSIADVVGVCAALDLVGIVTLSASEVAIIDASDPSTPKLARTVPLVASAQYVDLRDDTALLTLGAQCVQWLSLE